MLYGCGKGEAKKKGSPLTA